MWLVYRSKEAEELEGTVVKKMLSCSWLQHVEKEKQLPGESFTFRAVAHGVPQGICRILSS